MNQVKDKIRRVTIIDSLAELGPALRECRLHQGHGQEIVAEAAGVSRKTFSELESGKAIPKLDTVLALAHALGMRLALVPVEATTRLLLHQHLASLPDENVGLDFEFIELAQS
jgi:transcriptional regulator with XRE-family HTH domain